MKNGLVRAFIPIYLALSLVLTTISSPLLVCANTQNLIAEITQINSQDNSASNNDNDVNQNNDYTRTQDAVYTDNSNQSPTPGEEQYLEQVPGSTEYRTNRFIVKFTNGIDNSSLTKSLSGDLKHMRSFKSKKFKNYVVVTTKTKMKKNDFIEKFKGEKSNSGIEYIQPDYEMTPASLDAGATDVQAEQDTSEQQTTTDESTQVNQPDYENLPEYLQGLPPDDPMVVSWLKNQQAKSQAQNDTPGLGTPVDMADVNLESAWDLSEGEGTIVAILDTGIDITHKDIARSLWVNDNEIPGNGTDDDGNGYIDDTNGWNFFDGNNKVHQSGLEYNEWHGTHIAGIIAGVAPEAKIMPLKVFKNGTAYTSDIIEAIGYAEKNGARVANCSWGTSNENPALKEAIENSAMLFVCASGNSYSDIDINPVYPASYNEDNIITVASLNRDDDLSGYSNYGRTSVDVAAPGENIISATPGDRQGMSSGTSQSAAFVSGEAALVLGGYKNTSALGLKLAIIESCDKLPSLNNQVISGNKINCGSALSTTIPEKQKIISEYYKDISVTDSVYDETTVTGAVYGNRTDWDTDYQDTDIYSLYSGEIWNIKASMPTARYNLAAAKVNGKIYAIGGNDAVEEYDPATNTWATKASMPTQRDGLAAAVVNGKIYAIGGYNGGYLNTVEEYNPVTNTWSTKASMPTPRYLLAAAAVDGKIYAIGGNNSGNYSSDGFLNTVEEYDPVTNTWTTKANMSQRRNYLAAAVVDGKIYAIGGMYNNNSLSTVEEYNPATNTWTTKTGMPTARFGLSGAAADGNIYAIGGRNQYDGDPLNTVQSYNPSTNTWTTIASMPTSRDRLAAAAIGNRVYAIGGINNYNILNTVEELVLGTDDYGDDFSSSTTIEIGSPVEGWIDYVDDADVFDFTPVLNGTYIIESSSSILMDMVGILYDSNYNTLTIDDDSGEDWNFKITASLQAGQMYYLRTNTIIGTGPYMLLISRVPDNYYMLMSAMPTPRCDLAATAANGKIYAIGGYNNGPLNTVEEYDPATDNWTAKAAMLTSRYRLTEAEVNGKIYAIGGYDGSGYLATVEEYDPVANTWTVKAAMSTPRYGLAAAEINGKIYAIGGYRKSGRTNKVEEYDPVTNTWTNKANMPTPRYGLAAAAVNGKIYAIGGYDNSGYLNTVEEYNPVTNTWTVKAAMSTPRYGLAAAAVNGKIYAIGGLGSSGYLNTVEEYDPVTNTWLQITNMPIESSSLGVGEFNNRIYTIGGYNSNGYLNVVLEFNTQGNSISNPVLSAGSVTGQPGNVIQIPLTLNSLGEVGGLSFELKFDPNLLTFQNATLTSISGFASDYSCVTSYDPGVVTVIFYSSNAALIPDGVQSLGTLNFNVSAGVQSGQTCSLELQNVAMGDTWGDDTNPSIENGQFSVP